MCVYHNTWQWMSQWMLSHAKMNDIWMYPRIALFMKSTITKGSCDTLIIKTLKYLGVWLLLLCAFLDNGVTTPPYVYIYTYMHIFFHEFPQLIIFIAFFVVVSRYFNQHCWILQTSVYIYIYIYVSRVRSAAIQFLKYMIQSVIEGKIRRQICLYTIFPY